jgi:hypothetical protein
MAVVINEVSVTVDPGPTEAPPRDAAPTPAPQNTAPIVRAQIALMARRAARLHAD